MSKLKEDQRVLLHEFNMKVRREANDGRFYGDILDTDMEIQEKLTAKQLKRRENLLDHETGKRGN